MSRRTVGDMYKILLPEGDIRLFQYIGKDRRQLSSNIISVFDSSLSDWETLSDQEFANLPVAFYAHVFLAAGETLNVWHKIGRRKSVHGVDHLMWYTVLFDDFDKPDPRWQMWNTNSARRPPVSHEELLTCEFGYVIPPDQIVQRIVTGSYSLPKFPQHTKGQAR